MSTEWHTEQRSRRDARPWLLLIAFVVVLLDRLSKIAVEHHISMGSGKVIIPKVFRITHVLNTGAAFSMFAESASPLAVRIGLIIFSIIAALAVLFMLVRYGKHWSAASVGFALVLGGAIGNLYDRAVLHYVIDFLEVHIGSYHWPDFNIADSAISVGAVLLLVEMIWPSESATDHADGSNKTANGDVLGA
ncbi:signal peptidase II [Terriglobus roseus DSM 18391]|uniref:Lipoprotein signal peptidase n=1 Tax=Terriglobus roseus (strain DSM 18391 / NRRL B-41598 / KBS 63) TaxID=926566 RepID=I3ZG23_TERRK|nr:signal peptidase II [Terriglobus roseus]AFL88191.1 signal peptidase II [Terriglobus roseus DSM 18391]